MTQFELLTPREMAEADRLAIAGGIGEFELMQNAGVAVADAARDMTEEAEILVLAGPGNNGGDGFVAATELRRAGRAVRVALLGDRGALTGSAALAARAYEGPLEPLTRDTDLFADLVVDALFGAGLSRDLDDEVPVRPADFSLIDGPRPPRGCPRTLPDVIARSEPG